MHIMCDVHRAWHMLVETYNNGGFSWFSRSWAFFLELSNVILS